MRKKLKRYLNVISDAIALFVTGMFFGAAIILSYEIIKLYYSKPAVMFFYITLAIMTAGFAISDDRKKNKHKKDNRVK